MNPISKSKFCTDIIGAKPQYMSKIEYQLTMVKVPGKKKEQVDLHGADTLRFLKDRDISKADIPAATPPAKRQPSGLGNNSSGTGAPQTSEEKKAKDKNILLKNEKLQLEIDQKRNNLVEKNLTDIFFGKMYQIDSDQLKQLGSKLSPKIFSVINERNKIKTNSICELAKIKDKEEKESVESILSSGEKEIKTKIVGIFENSIHLILKDIKDEIDNFLSLLEADAI